MLNRNSSSLQFWSICLGNFFEHFDTALFGFLASFLAPLIFPDHDLITALILTYGMIPLGMLARPVGALFFGYIGDIYGRQQALFISLAGMSFVSGCLAFSPTYQQGGVIAPLIFCIGRVLQNFFAAGEAMGGAIFLLEHAPKKKHDLLSSLFSASTIGGILLASASVSLLTYCQAISWGWRILYAFGCLTALFGCLIRWQAPMQTIQASLTFKQSVLDQTKLLWVYRKEIFKIAITAGFSYANYSIAIVLMNGFIPLISSFTKAELINLNTSLLILDFCALPFFGWLSSKFSRKKIMIGALLSIILGGVPAFFLLEQASFFSIVIVRIFFVLCGVAFFAPFHAWTQELVPSPARYVIISFGYAIGSQLFGGPTTALSLWMFKQTGIVSSAVWYLVLLAVASYGIIKERSLKHQPLYQN